MKKEVVLYTAGVDSYILREFLIRHGSDVDCLYFDHGGRYTRNEMKKIDELQFPVIVNDTINMKDLEQPDAFIPNRNPTFCIAANSLGYDKIWIGGSKSDRVCDNNEKVFERLSEFLTSMNGRYIKIDSPFWGCYKDDMVKWYNSVSNVTDLVYNTFSCFDPVPEYIGNFNYGNSKMVEYKTEECLNCSACFRKCAVLFNAGIYIDFKNPKIVRKYFEDFKRPLTYTARSSGTMNYISAWLAKGNKCE